MRLEKRILVVDDDDAIRALLMTVLRRRGYQADSARNGLDALERLAVCRYALVVLDLMMPRMSGYEVLDHLDTLAEDMRPFVLVLTAGLQPKKFDTRYVVGMLQKPFDIELLVDTVSGCLTAAVARPQAESCLDAADRPAAPLPDETN